MLNILYIKLFLLLLVAILCGYCYRLGGSSKGNRLFRILGCSLCVVIVLVGLFWGKSVPFWAYLLTFGANAGMVSAYWGLDEKKWGYWAHGLGLSLAILPAILFTGAWLSFVLRTIVLTVFITIWSEFTSIDFIEEWGRGFFILITLALFLL